MIGVSRKDLDMAASSLGRAAKPNDVPAVAACLASAFYNDPLWGRWLFPDEATRYGRVYELMCFWVAAATRYPWVRMTDGAEAVAVWIPPGKPEMSDEEQTRLVARMRQLLAERAGELEDLFDRFDEHHPARPPHYYLSLWGTHRDHAGRGLGTALIRDNLARIDREGMPAYVESSNPANLPRYEALGFRRTGELGPSGGPVVATMWREPKAAICGI